MISEEAIARFYRFNNKNFTQGWKLFFARAEKVSFQDRGGFLPRGQNFIFADYGFFEVVSVDLEDIEEGRVSRLILEEHPRSREPADSVRTGRTAEIIPSFIRMSYEGT